MNYLKSFFVICSITTIICLIFISILKYYAPKILFDEESSILIIKKSNQSHNKLYNFSYKILLEESDHEISIVSNEDFSVGDYLFLNKVNEYNNKEEFLFFKINSYELCLNSKFNYKFRYYVTDFNGKDSPSFYLYSNEQYDINNILKLTKKEVKYE